MVVAYHTLTGNTRRFAERVAAAAGTEAFPIDQAPPGPLLLVTHTFRVGQVPEGTMAFLNERAGDVRGVISSGSYHWGPNFAKAADIIAQLFGIPVVAKIDKSGSQQDIQEVATWISNQ